MKKRKPFKRFSNDKWIAGVCAGIAYTWGIPVIWIRIAMIAIFFVFTNPVFDYVGQFIFWFYLVAWIFAPKWDIDLEDYEERTS